MSDVTAEEKEKLMAAVRETVRRRVAEMSPTDYLLREIGIKRAKRNFILRKHGNVSRDRMKQLMKTVKIMRHVELMKPGAEK